MGKEMKYVNGRWVSAANDGLAKAMPLSEATGVAFAVLSRCGPMKTV
jgi:hypothetical protein